MNDEILLKQLDEILPQEDASRPASTPVGANQVYPQALHARVWASERTQHIVWERPSEPRFQVSRGGIQRDWKLARQVGANLAFLTLLIAALVFWPHFHTRPASSTLASSQPPAAPFPQSAQPTAPGAYRANLFRWPTAGRSGTGLRPAASTNGRALPIHPSLYADSSTRNYAPLRTPLSYRPVTPFCVTSYQVAPPAPLAGSVPPMQSPY